jgi:hypothetical protein
LPAWIELEKGRKRAALCWHRRAGKDDICLHRTAIALHERIGNYWHMLPLANQVRTAIWEAVNPHTGKRRIDEAFPQELRESTRDNDMMIRFKNGSTWKAMGSDNYQAAIGSPPIGAVFSEYAQADPNAWAYLRPIFAENGGWSLFISTPRGRNHFAKMMEMAKADPANWYSQILTARDTGALRSEILDQELREYIKEHGQDAGQSLFDQEYMCSFDAPNLGAIYAKWMARAEQQGRIKRVEFDPSLPVHTAWDLGYDDPTAIWFWQHAWNEIRLIDYFEDSGQDVLYYTNALHEREKSKGYKYGSHYVPHDAANKLMAAGGRSIVAQAAGDGVKMTVIPATSQQNGINALRATLDLCWFDVDACERGIEALRSYHFEYDEDLRTFREKPLHDWSSHACDAMEIIGQVWRNKRVESAPEKPKFYPQITARELFWPPGESRPSERI